MTIPPALSALIAQAGPMSWAGLGALGWHLGWGIARPFVMPKIEAALTALPAMLAARAKARFDAAVAAGNVPPPLARLARKLKRAVFEWANEEMPDAPGAEKMDAAIAYLAQIPLVGLAVSADPAAVRRDLQLEYDAMRAQVKKEAAAPEPLAVKTTPAPAAPITTTP